MKIISAAKTDVGRKRPHNEDAYKVDEELGLFVVADGMGGHAAGEVASQEAVECLRDNVLANIAAVEEFRDNPTNDSSMNIRRVMELAVRAAAYQVFGLSEVDPDRKGMGTTLSMLLLLPAAAFLAHVGDSRIYMIRSGRVKQITSDHTYVAAMVEQGKMTEEQARTSRYSNVLIRAVGSHDYVEVDTRVVQHKLGDVFLLCSDGLSGYLKDEEIPNVIVVDDLPGSVDKLIDLALRRGGKDNITVIFVRIDP
ncbi:MAG: Stp1/IreP family PP2C-type Ser/Thr phosphatase [Deltaproteobacteria bacterium]|nr:Stp1/IreP family PP2C-type Ser/Thr phosphatase [Deltaproteobacteria bacterium]